MQTRMYCQECRSWHVIGAHLPIWLIRFDDNDKWQEYPAQDVEDAALRAGEEYDSYDYSIAKGGEVEISVRRFDQEPGEAVVFVVSGEAVMQYNAVLKGD